MISIFKPTKGKIILTILVTITMMLTFYQLGIIYNTLFTVGTLDYIIFAFDIVIMVALTYIFTSIGFHFMKIKW